MLRKNLLKIKILMILNNKNLNRKKSSILKRDSVIFSVMQKVSTQILEIKIKRHLTVEMALSDITMMKKQNQYVSAF